MVIDLYMVIEWEFNGFMDVIHWGIMIYSEIQCNCGDFMGFMDLMGI